MSINCKYRKAFTLAELLMSLAVIGVISALTMPVIYTNYQKSALKSSFKKAHYILDDVTKSITFDKRNIVKAARTYHGESGGGYKDAPTLMNAYYDKLKVTNNFSTSGYTIKSYNGKASNPPAGGRFAYPNKVLANGMLFGIYINEGIVNITIDTNGRKKPNRLGFDIFCYHVGDDGELQTIKMSRDFTEAEKAAQDAAIVNSNKYTPQYVPIQQSELGDPCSITSSQRGNGYGCSWYALADKYPHDSSKSYWDNLP